MEPTLLISVDTWGGCIDPSVVREFFPTREVADCRAEEVPEEDWPIVEAIWPSVLEPLVLVLPVLDPPAVEPPEDVALDVPLPEGPFPAFDCIW